MHSFAMVRAFIFLALISSFVVVSAQNEPCYLCNGDPTANFTLPDVILDIPIELQAASGLTEIPCGDLFDFAIGGLLNSTQCDLASASSDLQIACGCSNLASVPVAAPVAAPTIGSTIPPTISMMPSSVPSQVDSSIVPSIVPSDVPSGAPVAVGTSTPVAADTTAPSDAPSETPSDVPSSSPVMCPDGEVGSNSKKKGGKMKGGMMMGDKKKGKMSKDSEKRRRARAHGEPDDDEGEGPNDEYEYECPEYELGGKGGMKGKGMNSEDKESKGMMELKERAPPEDDKKESKRLRYQL